MVLASACFSDETRAYSATRNSALRVFMAYPPHKIFRIRRLCWTGQAPRPRTPQPRVGAGRGAPIHRRGGGLAVPNGCAGTRERENAVAVAKGDGSTWSTP